MESKSTSKKILSIFWCILYCMPLVILLITYIGYLNVYKESSIIFTSDDNTILSLFDFSLMHINNSFDGFIMSPLYNVLNDFSINIGINCDGFISNFILLLLSWFVQLSFIRLLIDLLVIIPNFLRNCFKGVS